MKKLLILFLSLLLPLAACTVKAPVTTPADPDIGTDSPSVAKPVLCFRSVSAGEKDGVKLEATGFREEMIEALLTNNTQNVVSYGQEYALKVNTSEGWYNLIHNDVAWTMIAYELQPGDSAELKFGILDPEERFESGEYRLTIPSLGLTAEFILEWTE